MPLTLTDALNSYGFVGQLANSIPDLKKVLAQAVAGEWSPDAFNRALQDSPWWKTHAESVRQLATTQAMDPATYKQNLANAANKVWLIAGSMGRQVDFNKFALQALANNWDDEQIRSQLGLQGKQINTQGDAAQLQSHMRQLLGSYGVAFTDASVNQWTDRVQQGRDTIDGFESLVKARAKAQYPHLANQIDAGMTVHDIADPYIAQYAQTLEVPETQVTLNDPAIQKALQAKDPTTGAFTTKPMYEFTRQLKEDPRWDKTKGAESEAYRMVNRLGKDMGFLS